MAINITTWKAIFSAVTGWIAYQLGGYDIALETMFHLTILDFISGVFVAIWKKEISSKKCANGIIKKVFIYFTVALAVTVQHFIGDTVPLREGVIIFYIVSEGISCLENIGKVVEYPPILKNTLAQLNGDKDE